MKNFKQDFGLYLRSNFKENLPETILIVEPFIIHCLTLYPNHTSSITATLDNRLVTFDFNDSVLKVFFWVLKNLKLINRPDIDKQIMDQKDEPIIIRFYKEQAYVTGMVLTCKFGEKDKSVTTNEEFIPLIIESVKIAQEPVATLLKSSQVK